MMWMVARSSEAASNARTAASTDPDCKRPQFGTRFLEDPEAVLQHNAWDNVEPTVQQMDAAHMAVETQKQFPVPAHIAGDVRDNASQYWHVFYNDHKNKFYRDRHWLLTEFPELLATEGMPTKGGQDRPVIPQH